MPVSGTWTDAVGSLKDAHISRNSFAIIERLWCFIANLRRFAPLVHSFGQSFRGVSSPSSGAPLTQCLTTSFQASVFSRERMLGMCNPGVGVSSVPDTSGRVAPCRGSVRWRLGGGKAVVVRTGADTLRAGILIVNGLRACLSGPTLRAKQWRQRCTHR